MDKNFIIYKAENSFTGEVYIGATTKCLHERKSDHLQKSTKKSEIYFHQAISTYGSENFSWTEIDYANSANELAIKESEYIILYNSIETGYNSDRGGGFSKTIYQFDTDNGNLISTFENLTNAANAVNADKRSISNACLNINKTCKGYCWSYENKFSLDCDKRKKQVIQRSLDDDLISYYESASEASRKTGVPKTCITRCCRKERKHSGGFIWEYS